jgi:murein L,D-transpeptidase YafK
MVTPPLQLQPSRQMQKWSWQRLVISFQPMTSSRYCLFLAAVFSLFSLTGAGQAAQSSEPEGNLQLFLYSAEGPVHFIVVEKKHQKLKLYEQADNLRLIKEFPCATGENQGTKKSSGDSRTPEGIYHITEIYEDKQVTVFGSRAFHLDYPNIFDSHAGRFGDGIYIHGTNKKLIPNSTNGCITLKNSDLDELAPYLSVNAIPILVLDAESDFVVKENPGLVKNSDRFKEIVERLTRNAGNIPIENIRTLSSLQCQEQGVVSASYKVFDDELTQYNEQRRVYQRRLPTGTWRTLYAVQRQDAAPTLLAVYPNKKVRPELVAKTGNADVKAGVPVAKAAPLQAKTNPTNAEKPPLNKSEEMFAFIEKWRQAWVTKDIESYMNCYSPSFKNGAMDKDQWRTRKTALNKKYRYIKVDFHNIVIEWTTAGAKVSFHQSYKSDQLQTSGTKTLQLVNRKNRWLIENEVM